MKRYLIWPVFETLLDHRGLCNGIVMGNDGGLRKARSATCRAQRRDFVFYALVTDCACFPVALAMFKEVVDGGEMLLVLWHSLIGTAQQEDACRRYVAC